MGWNNAPPPSIPSPPLTKVPISPIHIEHLGCLPQSPTSAAFGLAVLLSGAQRRSTPPNFRCVYKPKYEFCSRLASRAAKEKREFGLAGLAATVVFFGDASWILSASNGPALCKILKGRRNGHSSKGTLQGWRD